ncbi:MAG: RNA polymerase sigma factor [Bacteroidia bacterium]|nr:RNA polymerase sigma factor [Bacteroidia bacterium]
MDVTVIILLVGALALVVEKSLQGFSIGELIKKYFSSKDNQVALELLLRYREASEKERGEIIWSLLAPHRQDLSKIIAAMNENPQDEIQRLYVRLHHLFLQGKIPDKNWKSWLARILRNDLINQKKRKSPVLSLSFEHLPEPENPQPDETMSTNKLQEALRKLPDAQRQVIELRYLQSEDKIMTYKEIADIMNCSVGQVHGYLDRAKENLRMNLNEYV